MRQSIRFLCATSLLLSGLASAAPSLPEQSSERPRSDQIDEFTGAYRLEDGRRVQVLELHSRLYVDLDRSVRLELFVAGPGKVASRDGRVTVTKAQSENEQSTLTLRRTAPARPLLSSL
jgi:hypothetical protein